MTAQEAPLKQCNLGKIPESMDDQIDNLLRKLNIQISDAGFKVVPKYVSGPSALLLWLTSSLNKLEAAEKTRRQFIIEGIVEEFRKIVEKYSLER